MTAWCNQILSNRALLSMLCFQIFSTFAMVDPTQPNAPKTEKSRPNPTHGSTRPTDNSGIGVSALLSAARGTTYSLLVYARTCWCTRARCSCAVARRRSRNARPRDCLPACRTPRRVLKPTHQGAAPVRRPQDRESAARNAAQVGRLPTTQRRTGTMMTLAEQSRWERMPLDPAAYIGRMCRPPAKSSGKMLAEKLINSHSRAVSKHKLHTAYEFSEIFQSCLGSLAYLFARPVLKLFQQPFRHQQVE